MRMRKALKLLRRKIYHSSLLSFGELAVIYSAFTARQRIFYAGIRAGPKRPVSTPNSPQADFVRLTIIGTCSWSRGSMQFDQGPSAENPISVNVSVGLRWYYRVVPSSTKVISRRGWCAVLCWATRSEDTLMLDACTVTVKLWIR